MTPAAPASAPAGACEAQQQMPGIGPSATPTQGGQRIWVLRPPARPLPSCPRRRRCTRPPCRLQCTSNPWASARRWAQRCHVMATACGGCQPAAPTTQQPIRCHSASSTSPPATQRPAHPRQPRLTSAQRPQRTVLVPCRLTCVGSGASCRSCKQWASAQKVGSSCPPPSPPVSPQVPSRTLAADTPVPLLLAHCRHPKGLGGQLVPPPWVFPPPRPPPALASPPGPAHHLPGQTLRSCLVVCRGPR